MIIEFTGEVGIVTGRPDRWVALAQPYALLTSSRLGALSLGYNCSSSSSSTSASPPSVLLQLCRSACCSLLLKRKYARASATASTVNLPSLRRLHHTTLGEDTGGRVRCEKTPRNVLVRRLFGNHQSWLVLRFLTRRAPVLASCYYGRRSHRTP